MNQGQTQADGDRGKAGRSQFVGRTHDDNQEECGQYEFDQQSSHHVVTVRRVLAETVAGKAGSNSIKTGFTGSNQIQNARGGNRTDNLGYDVRQQVFTVETAADEKADGNGRIEVAAGNVADGVSHGQYGQAECQGDTGKTNAKFRVGCCQNCAAAAAEYQPESAEKFCKIFFHLFFLVKGGGVAEGMNHNNIASNRKTDLPVFSGLDKRQSENGDKWIGTYIWQVEF